MKGNAHLFEERKIFNKIIYIINEIKEIKELSNDQFKKHNYFSMLHHQCVRDQLHQRMLGSTHQQFQ